MDPHYFPFEIINSNDLISGDNYYIKLNDRVVDNFLSKRRTLPVSHLKGTFIRLYNEDEVIYAVYKNVEILNKKYKIGLCNQMLVRYPDGYLAIDGCDSYNSTNKDREVYFNINKWIFGKQTETSLLSRQVMKTIIQPKLNQDMSREINEFREIKKSGGKSRRKRSRVKRQKINRKRKTNKRYY